jgi:hypothetical protein
MNAFEKDSIFEAPEDFDMPKDLSTREGRLEEFAYTGDSKYLKPGDYSAEFLAEIGLRDVDGEIVSNKVADTYSPEHIEEKVYSFEEIEQLLQNHSTEIHTLSYEQVLAFFKEIVQKHRLGSMWHILIADGVPTKDGERVDGFNDHMFRAFAEVSQGVKDPESIEQLGEYYNVIGQNPQMLRPETLISTVADMQWRSDIHSFFKDVNIHTLNYAFSFYGSSLWDALAHELDYKKEKNFFRTGILLDTVQRLYNVSQQWGFSADRAPEHLASALHEAHQHSEGSYLLQLRTKQVLEVVEKESGDYSTLNHDSVPFSITPDQYALDKGDGLYISPPEALQEVRRLSKALLTAREQSAPIQNIRSLYASLSQLCDQKLSLNDIVLQRADMNPEKRAEKLYDFEYLHMPTVRKILEEDFGVQLHKLLLKEQHYLLNILKTASKEHIEYIQNFSKRFGAVALRTFLVSEYDDNMSERIFTFAELTEPEIVRDIFNTYAHVLDNAEALRVSLEKISERTDDEDSSLFFTQFQEALVRRTGHLFFAAERIATNDPMMGEHGMGDIESSFRGMEVATALLADLHAQEHFEIQADSQRTRGNNFVFHAENRETKETFQLKVFIRPEKDRNGQARVNVELSFGDLPSGHPLRRAFFQQVSHLKEQKCVETSVLRLALDLDDGVSPPRISFDMGRNTRKSETQERTGDVFGNILDKAAPEGHHLFASFGERFSTPQGFARIAEAFRNYFTKAIPHQNS